MFTEGDVQKVGCGSWKKGLMSIRGEDFVSRNADEITSRFPGGCVVRFREVVSSAFPETGIHGRKTCGYKLIIMVRGQATRIYEISGSRPGQAWAPFRRRGRSKGAGRRILPVRRDPA